MDRDLLHTTIQWGNGENYDKTPTLQNALDLFKNIKKEQRETGHELDEAKADLICIFDVDAKNLQNITKNNIYLMHQSMMVNSIFAMLRGE